MTRPDYRLGDRLAAVLLADLTALRWTLAWVGLMLSAGMLFTAATTANYAATNQFADRGAWGVMFGVYGIAHVLACLYRLPKWVACTAGVFGLWLWVYLFLSFTVFDPTPTQATELMLAVPVIVEVWLLAECIFTRKAGRTDGL